MSMHAERLASRIRRTIQAEFARGLNDPRITGMVSITGVQVADDLADATVLVSIHPEEAEALTMHGLRSAARHLRSRLARGLGTRRVPRLHFKLDRSVKLQAGITRALAADRGDDDAEPEVADPTASPEPGKEPDS